MSGLIGLVMSVSMALAQSYWTEPALLKDMFPASTSVAPETWTPDAAAVATLSARLGAPLPHPTWTIYVARTADHVDGYAVFDEQVGQHEPISFGVQISPEGVILRQEVLVYRERYGAEVVSARFRDQFKGRTAADPLVAGKDVKIISGATYSSRAMAIGVKRVAVVVDVWRAGQAG